ncbi:MAG: hypothetical protein CL868_12525 [Cytophagaceae bacterium]|nr:hypothetical protein [Cytophagaceae bacterium]|tara:strand:- start:1424 stop:1651 length:228 start_codon:yes stop_codon:yes gene_type:complete
MKKTIFVALTMLITGVSLTSCREAAQDTEKETVIVKEVQVEKQDNEGILERTAKKVDKEVNKEINQEIDNIGDDN